jgi:hypothetical protein
MYFTDLLKNSIKSKKFILDLDQHSNLFSPELRCFEPVSAPPNFVAFFGGEFASVKVQWLIQALYG